MEFTLKRAAFDDLVLLGEIRRRAIMAQPESFWSLQQKHMAADGWAGFNIHKDYADYTVYIVVVNNTDAAFVAWKANYLATLFILPESQNTGLGSKLLEFAEGKISAAHNHIWLFAHPYSERFYKKRGYKKQPESEDPFATGPLYKFQKNF